MFSVRATPTQANETHFAEPWFPEPDTRGTSSLLYSCIFTLSICVYSAIHLNIPPRGEPESIQGWRKTKWVLIAILAPEIVLYTAWYQYYLAKSFCQEMYSLRLRQEGIQPIVNESKWQQLYSNLPWRPKDNVLTAEKPSTIPDPTPTPPPCTLAYGFYVIMGGLTVDTTDIHDTISSVRLTPGGVLRLAECSSWKYFSVPEATIHDKSKADNLAKLLIFLQVSWTVLQCISRKATGLPLAILEVHTLVHAGCAMVMYAFWFRKPLDIRDSTLLDASKFANEFALEFMRSPIPFDSHFNTMPLPQCYLSAPEHTDMPAPDTEAGYLIFDTSRLDAALESGDAETPGVISILDSATGVSNVHPMLTISSDSAGESPSLDYRCRGVENRQLEHQASVAKAGIYRPVTANVDAEQIVWTGQTLSSGVGPDARLTGGFRRIMPNRLEVLINHLLQERPGPVETIIVSPDLRGILPLPEDFGFECHQITFSLSKKDMRRWHRAAAAFARTVLVEGSVGSATNDGLNQAQHQNSFEPGAEAAEGQIGRLQRMSRPPSWNLRMFREDACNRRSLNFDTKDLLKAWRGPARETAGFTSSLALAVMASLYAAVHLALWTYTFPSTVESLLWKIASCTLGVPAVIFILIAGIDRFVLSMFAFSVRMRLTQDRRFRESVDANESASSDHAEVNSQEIPRQCLKIIKMIFGSSFDFVRSWKERDGLSRLRDLGSTASGWRSRVARGTVRNATAVSRTLYYCSWRVVLLAIIFFCLSLLLLIPCALLYILSRIYIVVESFVSLRKVPIGVYQGVTWAQYIPHF